MSTVVNYRGVTFYNCLTRLFEQTPQNDSSNTDQMFSRFRISVESILSVDSYNNAYSILGIAGGDIRGGVAQQLTALEIALGEHRGVFEYYQNGVLVISSNSTIDCDSGPRVISVQATRHTPQTIRITFTIEICLVPCTMTNNQRGVLSNRWSAVEDLDENFCATRIWRGKLRIQHVDLNAHSFRGLVVPVLYRGWKRKRYHFTVDPNGLELNYEIEDRQLLGDAPPPGAVRMSGTHVEGIDMSGLIGKGSISVRLDGPVGQDRRYLIEKAAQIVYAKAAIDDFKTGHYLDYTLVEHFGDDVCAVEARATFKRTDTSSQPQGGSLFTKTIGFPLSALALTDYRDEETFLTGPYGSGTLAGLFYCYLQSPCNNEHAIPQSYEQPQSQNTPPPDGPNNPRVSAGTGVTPQDFGQINTSPGHQQAAYVHAKVESIYEIDEGRVFCPIAQPGGRFAAGKDSIAAIRLHPRTAKRIVVAEFERLGQWPDIWKLDDFDDTNGVKNYFQRCTPTLRPPEPGGDGRILYAIDARYEFMMSRAPSDSEIYFGGTVPWDANSTTSANGLPASGFIPPNGAQGI